MVFCSKWIFYEAIFLQRQYHTHTPNPLAAHVKFSGEKITLLRVNSTQILKIRYCDKQNHKLFIVIVKDRNQTIDVLDLHNATLNVGYTKYHTAQWRTHANGTSQDLVDIEGNCTKFERTAHPSQFNGRIVVDNCTTITLRKLTSADNNTVLEFIPDGDKDFNFTFRITVRSRKQHLCTTEGNTLTLRIESEYFQQLEWSWFPVNETSEDKKELLFQLYPPSTTADFTNHTSFKDRFTYINATQVLIRNIKTSDQGTFTARLDQESRKDFIFIVNITQQLPEDVVQESYHQILDYLPVLLTITITVLLLTIIYVFKLWKRKHVRVHDLQHRTTERDDGRGGKSESSVFIRNDDTSKIPKVFRRSYSHLQNH
nr:hypothetical protein [Tawny frogmouth aviadenovirus A]